ncbi:MAG: hypothetical protein R3F05_19385 [Planctomycetota bacterium]
MRLTWPRQTDSELQLAYESGLSGDGAGARSCFSAASVADGGTVRLALPSGWIGGAPNELLDRGLYTSLDGGQTYVPVGPWDESSTYVRPAKEELVVEVGAGVKDWVPCDHVVMYAPEGSGDAFVHRHLVAYRFPGTDATKGEYLWLDQRLRRGVRPEWFTLDPKMSAYESMRIVDLRR